MLAQCRRASNSYYPGFPGWAMSVTQHIPCGTAGWAGTLSSTESLSTTSGEANSYWRKYKMSAYRLSVVGSVAPPGTAWDAEGLRGNEANKNKLMVLVRVQARKWQSGRVLHKRTSPVVSSSIGSPASNWEALPAFRLHAGTCVGRELKPDNQTKPRLRGPAVGPASMKRPRRRGQSGGYRRCGAQSPIGHALGDLKCVSRCSSRIRHTQYIGRTSGKLQRCHETKPH